MDCNSLAQAYKKQQGLCIKEDCGVKLGKLVMNSSRLSAFSGDKSLSQLQPTFDVVLDAPPEQKADPQHKTLKKKATKQQEVAIQTLVALLRQNGGRMDSATLGSAYRTKRGKAVTQDCGKGLGALLEMSKRLAAFRGGKLLTKLPPGIFDVVLLEATAQATGSPKHTSSTVVVDNVAKCVEVLKSLSEHKVLGLDIEGVNLGSNGTVSLIQLADADGNAYLFDIFKCEHQIWLLKGAVLESDTVVKVVHDVRADSAGLFANYEIKLRSVFDTQVALQYFKPEFRVKEVGMNSMLAALDLPVVADKAAMAKNMQRGRFWETRPLTPSMISYAAGDVRNLVKAFHMLKGGTSRTKGTEHSFTAQCDNRVKGGHVTFAQNSADVESDTYADRAGFPNNTPLPFVFAPTPPYKRIFLDRSGPTTAAAALPQQEDTGGDEDEKHSSCTEDEMAESSTGGDPNTPNAANASPPLQPGAVPPTDTAQLPPLPPAPHTGALPEDLYTALPVLLGQRIADMQFDQPLVEIVIDRGRDVTLRFAGDEEQDLPGLVITVEDALQALSAANVREKDFLDAADHRSGIGLHRISAITRGQTIDGLTYRIGRHVKGSAEMLKNVVCKIAQSTSTDTPLSMLLLGRPGVGKTTLLREIAYQLSTTFRKRVVVVDTSDEICGYEDQPHACVGRSRRMPVVKREEQYKVLIEAVQNHNPQVVVVDEIADSREAKAVKTITQRGVCVIGTAHGASLSNLMKNPDLTSLIGGLQTVTLGDIAAKERAGKHGMGPRKTATERSGAPPFNMLVELQAQDKWRIHLKLAKSVDAMLAGQAVECDVLQKHADGTMTVTFANGK